jgi:hypothetical protein
MAMPSEQIILVNSPGSRLLIEDFVKLHRSDARRVLVDDGIGLTLYVGDLDVYALKALPNGQHFAEKLTELPTRRFPKKLARHQIGSTVLSVTANTPFVIKDADGLKKVRAENLKKGMVLANGEKVYS